MVDGHEQPWTNWLDTGSLRSKGSCCLFFPLLLLNNIFQIANYFVLFFEMQHDGTDGSVGETANRISNSPTSPSAAPQQQDKTKRPANIQVCC
jgi:hypothetical protein